MSIDPYEAAQEQAYEEFVDSIAEELYEEHKEQAVEEFVEERLQSYYRENLKLGEKAIRFIEKSKEIIESDPTTSLIYSSIATEVTLKSVLIKPIVTGLVHSDSVAELIATLIVKQNGIDRFKEFIFKIINDYVEISGGLENFKRDDSSVTLWKEREHVQKTRNKIMHQAENCSAEDANLSYQVCKTFLDLTNQLLIKIGLHLKDNGEIGIGHPEQLNIF